MPDTVLEGGSTGQTPCSHGGCFFFFLGWLLVIYFPLGARHKVMGLSGRPRVAWIVKSGALSTSFFVFCCFDIKEPNCFCLWQPA